MKGPIPRALTVFLALAIAASAAALEGNPPAAPKHPAVEAPDAEWDLWHQRHEKWSSELDWRTRYALVADETARQTNAPASYDWRLEARFRGLTLRQIHQLASDGIVASGRDFGVDHKLDAPLTGVFVTSDMVLHAYNAMTADFLRQFEMQRTPELRRKLTRLWTNLITWSLRHRMNGEQIRAAIARDRRIVGTALLCLGADVEFQDPAIARDCLAERDAIMNAQGTRLPAWLGPADQDFIGIDYSRMKPVGFYAGNETLTRLLRAVRWLQAVPFRPERDIELTAAAILADAADDAGIYSAETLEGQWLGQPNDPTIAELTGFVRQQLGDGSPHSQGSLDLPSLRRALGNRTALVHANDDIRWEPKLWDHSSLPSIIKILPAYLTADSLLFSQVIVEQPDRLPDGRMITAYLGDSSAIDELAQAGWPERTLAIIRQAANRRSASWTSPTKPGNSGNPYDDCTTFNSLLLYACSALFLPPANGAPDFLLSPAWRAKSRNAVLAAWTEKKHTWVLHEVEPVVMLGAVGPPPPPPGLVEPNPLFFRRMAALVEQTITWMSEHRLLGEKARGEKTDAVAADLLRLARRIHELQLDTQGNQSRRIDRDELVGSSAGVIQETTDELVPSEKQWPTLSAADFDRLRTSALSAAEAVLDGLDPASQPDELAHQPLFRRQRWENFLQSLRSLAAMAEKQLRGEAWDDTEKTYLTFGIWNDYYEWTFLKDSGTRVDPDSIGPEIAPVAFDPNSGNVLHAGTGNSAQIYVLYPWKGHSFLYHGPITPYYEFPSKIRLSDLEWRALLKSDKPPSRPAWLTSIAP